MSNHLAGTKDAAGRVNYAYTTTQRQYDKHPPNNDLVPIADAINAWAFICGCYMGIEQTMKLLIRMRGGVSEKILKSTHNLGCLYELLDLGERSVVTDYYRVYRSLHNFDAGNTVLETAKQFIQHIGNGYVAWRYILVEDPERVPKMHLGSMLEIWRALVNLVQHRVSCPDSQFKPRTLATHLDDYICTGVFRDAYSDNEWQAAVQDKNSAVEFEEVKEWIFHKGRPVAAGIDLFFHHARGTENSIQASPLLRRVLLRAADKACSLVQAGGPFQSVCGRADIAMFHHRICTGGLVWDANNGVFK